MCGLKINKISSYNIDDLMFLIKEITGSIENADKYIGKTLLHKTLTEVSNKLL